jgi:hypothetical protein
MKENTLTLDQFKLFLSIVLFQLIFNLFDGMSATGEC